MSILFPKQKWYLNRSNSRLNIAEGSVRSGKTFVTNLRFLSAIGESKKGLPADAIDVIIGKTVGSLKRNIINPICELLGSEAQYFSGRQELNIWDNVIHIIGANDERAVGKIQGSTVRKAMGDELTLWPESFFKMLDSRLSTDVSQLFGTTNPGPPNHYLKKEYLNRKRDLDLLSFHFSIDDNTSLSKKYVSAIKQNYIGLWYKRFILGLWCAAEGAIYDFFDEEEHTIISWPDAQYHVVGVDYGTANPFTAGIFGVNHNTRPKIWCEAEYYYDSKKHQRQKTDAEYSDDLKMFVLDHLGKYWRTKVTKIYLDPSAESFEAQLLRDGFSGVAHADNSVIDGIRNKARMLKNGEYKISASCKNYIDEFFSYVWDDKAQAKGEDKPKKDNDHCQDMGRYVIQSEFGGTSSVNMGLLTTM